MTHPAAAQPPAAPEDLAPVTALLRGAGSPGVAAKDRDAYLRLLAENPRALHRDGGPVHLTASAVVVDAPIEHVALLWHRKGRFWVQPGGHIEPDETDLEASARREVAEEMGLTDLELVVPGPAVLHRHGLSSSFGACREHWDVQFLLRTHGRAEEVPLSTSEETPEAIWVPWPLLDGGPERSTAALPEGTVPDMAGKLETLARVIAAGATPQESNTSQ